ncbi:outer membrane protein OmpK [Sulfurovum riftiae]|uniref:Ion channel protein Tsx n=1 Tax=Sulfurovum riftiae TaxID=1630136 RepID=A0A151CGE6_9BACT|nr:outer membrane protein OmpK [Sulfurovum riftiae]KYJ86615.1 hypothetical protein AS592_07385 [Sulfurovum riftiae]
MKRGSLHALIAVFLLLSLPLQAEDPEVMHQLSEVHETGKKVKSKEFLTPNYIFWDISMNYLDWSSGTEQRAKGKTDFSDFVYLELEGGAGWDWGEFYFFADLENPTKSWDNVPTDDRRVVIKPILDVKLGETGLYIHLQDYFLKSKTFFVNNLVPGIAYKYSIECFWIRPFIGPHFQESTFYDGFNGWMAGWVFAYDFRISGQKFSLTNWHEFEWGRDEEHYLYEGEPVGDGRSHGVQGALALWWMPIKEITAGVQYRYNNYKLGLDAYATALIYSLKYNF